MRKLKKRGALWHARARRIETAIEASYFAPRFGLTKEEAVSIIKAAVTSCRKERSDDDQKQF